MHLLDYELVIIVYYIIHYILYNINDQNLKYSFNSRLLS